MQNEQLLQKINSPADLKMLTLDEMKLLAGEIRLETSEEFLSFR